MRVMFKICLCAVALFCLSFPALNARAGSGTLDVMLGLYSDTGRVLIGEEEGYYEDAGLDVELHNTMTWGAQYETMASGDLDIAFTTIDEFLHKEKSLRKIGRPIIYLMPTWEFTGLSFFSKSNVTPYEIIVRDVGEDEAPRVYIEQILGKKVSLPEGSVYENIFHKILGRSGYSEKDVRIVNASIDAGLYALQDPDVALAALGSNLFHEGRARGYIASLTARDAGMPTITGFAVREQFYKDHPGLVKKFGCIWYRMLAFSRENREGYYEMFNAHAKTRGAKQADNREGFDQTLDLNRAPASPAEAQGMFLNPQSPVYWEAVWTNIENQMRRAGKEDSIPDDKSGFVAPEFLKTLEQDCPVPQTDE